MGPISNSDDRRPIGDRRTLEHYSKERDHHTTAIHSFPIEEMTDDKTPPSTPSQQSAESNTGVAKEEWEEQRDHHKSLADTAFRTADYKTAIQEYTNAITFDPEHHILYSNRSAAHLSNGEKSKALADAKKCVELKPDFVKGHSRLASSMMGLSRWNEARHVYKHILSSLDKDNSVAKKGLEDCRVREQKAKEAEMEMMRPVQEEAKQKAAEAVAEEAQQKQNDESKSQLESKEEEKEEDDEDDLLNDFFDEVEEAATTEKKPTPPSQDDSKDGDSTKPVAENKIQIQLNDLGDAQTQIQRLLLPNHQWFNLNPFRVLDISHQAPLELIARRYKALSLLLHPDKVRNSSDNDSQMIEKAEEAFECVRKAMDSMKDEDKAKHFHDLVEEGMKQGKRDYDANPGDASLESFQEKATLKIFAEIENKRRDVERRKRNQDKRERDQEDAEVHKMKKERDFDKNWKDNTRVEKRIGNWRDFSGKKSKH